MEYACGQLWVGRHTDQVIVLDVDAARASREFERTRRTVQEPRGAPTGTVKQQVKLYETTQRSTPTDVQVHDALQEFGRVLRVLDCAQPFFKFLKMSGSRSLEQQVRPLRVRNIVRRSVQRRGANQCRMFVLNRWSFDNADSLAIGRDNWLHQSDALTVSEWHVLQRADFRAVNAIFAETSV